MCFEVRMSYRYTYRAPDGIIHLARIVELPNTSGQQRFVFPACSTSDTGQVNALLLNADKVPPRCPLCRAIQCAEDQSHD
jgi:hypothetical protein